MREFKIMGKDASLHDKAVKQAADYKPPRKKRAPKRDTYSKCVSKLDLRIHDPAVAKTVKSLAGGDLLRIEQLGVNDLIVHNNANWRKQK